MDILQVQDRLKNFSQDQLVGEMQAPTGNAPQFLVLSEIMRRKRMQDDFSAQKNKQGSETTVAQEAVAAAGVPQEGIAGAAQAMAPSTDMTQNTGVQAMASGGTVKKMQVGGAALLDPAIISMANRSGMSVEEFLSSLSPEEAARLEDYAARTANRERMTAMEPVGNPPVQEPEVGQFEPVNPSYVEQGSVFPNDTVRPPTGPLTEYKPLYNTREQLPLNITPADQLPERPVAPADRPGALADVEPLKPFLSPITDYLNSSASGLSAAEQYIQSRNAATAAGQAATGLGNPESMPTSELAATPAPAPEPPFIPEVEKQNAAGNPSYTLPEILGGMLPEDMSIGLSGTSSGAVAGPGRSPVPEAAAPAFDDRGAAIAERAAGLEGIAAKTAEQPTGPQGGSGSGSGSGGSGIAGAASGMTSYEQELIDALERREKAATQDKWLALAQVGLNLMASKNPTFGGALGEAGLAGVQAAQGARDQYEKDRLDLTGALEQSRMSRAQAAARGAGGANVKPINSTMIGNIEQQLADTEGQLAMLAPPSEPSFWSGEIDDPDRETREALKRRAGALKQTLSYAYATHGLPSVYDMGSESALDGDMSDPEE